MNTESVEEYAERRAAFHKVGNLVGHTTSELVSGSLIGSGLTSAATLVHAIVNDKKVISRQAASKTIGIGLALGGTAGLVKAIVDHCGPCETNHTSKISNGREVLKATQACRE